MVLGKSNVRDIPDFQIYSTEERQAFAEAEIRRGRQRPKESKKNITEETE